MVHCYKVNILLVKHITINCNLVEIVFGLTSLIYEQDIKKRNLNYFCDMGHLVFAKLARMLEVSPNEPSKTLH